MPDGRTLDAWSKRDGLFNWGAQRLPRWTAALAKARAGVGVAKVACVGDSTTSGVGSNPASATADCRRRAFPARLAEAMRARFNVKADASSVWCDGFEGGNLTVFEPRLNMGAGWTVSATFVAGGRALIDSTTNSNKLSFNPGFVTDKLDLYYVKFPGYADVVVSTADVFNASTSTAGVAGVGKLTVTRAVASAAAWDIQKSTNTPNVTLMIVGMDAYLSTDHNVSVWNMGASGSKVSHWATGAENYDFRNAIQTIAPDLSIVNLTINDWSQGTAENSYKTDLQTIITACQVTGDVLLTVGVPSNVAAASAEEQASTAAWAYDLARTNGIPLVDLSYRWIAQAYRPERGLYFDGQHPSNVGYADLGNHFAEVVAP